MPAIVVNWRSSGLATVDGHRAGIAARQPRLDLDGGEVHRRQVADRQRAIRNDAEERDRRHQQAGGDGTPDEHLGEVHGRLFPAPSALPALALPALPTLPGLPPCPACPACSPCPAWPPCPVRPAAWPPPRVRRRSGSSSRLEPELSFGDHRLAGVQALLDHDVFADPLPDGDGLLRHGVVRLDEEHELAVLPGLHRLARQHDRVRDRRHAQAHARELARPQAAVVVLEPRLQLDRVGGGVDHVVDEVQLAVHARPSRRPATWR